jgi:tetratricopeptide (TPR) repeat protein
MTAAIRKLVLPAIILVIALPVVVVLSDRADTNRVSLAESYEDSDLDLQGYKLKGFALGTEGLLADWYWIRSLQYLGGKIVKSEGEDLNIDDLRSLNPRLLYPLLDNATELDPKFMAAYTYGAVILPAIDNDLAIKLTEKGISNNPDAWRLYHYLGYIYWRNKDYEKAAQSYDRGAAVVGAAPFMREMAANMRTRGGSRETAYRIYTEIYDSAVDPQSRANAGLRLMQLDSLEELDVINEILGSLEKGGAPCPTQLAPVIPHLARRTLPRQKEFHVDQQRRLVDPSGVPYIIDQSTCTAQIDGVNSKIPKQ